MRSGASQEILVP